jgi:hypothetical protein
MMLLLVMGCRGPSAQSEAVSPSNTPEQMTSPLRPEETATSSPISPLQSDIAELSGAQEIGQALKPLVGEKVDVASEDLTLIQAEAIEWSDASLGCPQPGMVYAQVITPGWHFIYEDAEGERYDVRAPQDPTKFRLCEAEKGGDVPTPSPELPAPQAVLDRAKQAVARQAKVAASALTVRQVEPVEWPNSCLGCQRPDEMCLMVITPGYRIVLEAGDVRYEVHTDATGESIRVCEGKGGGPHTPSPEAQLPERVWGRQRALVDFLDEQHPGFGLSLLADPWKGRNVTQEGILGAETYRFDNAGWVVELTCPVVPEPECTGTLRHVSAGRLWEGTVDAQEQVAEPDARPALTYTVGPCDDSMTPAELEDWAGLDLTPVAGGFRFTQRLSYVCCADVTLAAGWDPGNDAVRLVASNLGEVCRCYCGYEIQGTVENLAPGAYTVVFWGVHKPPLHALEERFVTEITVP